MTSVPAWSTTDDSNTGDTPAGWPEGQSPGSVPGCGRLVMGAVARLFGDINGNLSATGAASNLQIVTSSDYSATAHVGPLILSTPFVTSANAVVTLTRPSLGASKRLVKCGQDFNNNRPDDGDIQANQKFLMAINDRELASSTYALLTPPHRQSGMTLVASGAITSAVASVTFGPIPGGAAIIEMYSPRANAGGVDLWARLGTVANIRSAAADYEWAGNEVATAAVVANTPTGNDSDTKIILYANSGATAVRAQHGRLFIHGLNDDGARATLEWQICSQRTNANFASTYGGGRLTSAVSCNAVQVLFSSNTIDGLNTTFNYRVYRMMG